MSPDVVLEKKLFRDVALVAAADGARVRVVAGVSSNVNAETKTKKTFKWFIGNSSKQSVCFNVTLQM